jgi:hypothetical protein
MSNWTDERTVQLETLVANAGAEVSQTLLKEVAVGLDVTPRSVGAKLRKMGYTVELASATARSKWSESQEAGLRQLLTEQEGRMTYAEFAAAFEGGAFTAKQVQGKVLSMEMTGFVKETPKVEVARTYTKEQETTFVSMAAEGASIESIAEALGKEINSIRGKALSLSRQVEGFVMPTQATSHAKTKTDPITDLGDKIETMTVAEVAEVTGRTERGVKTILTRRGLNCANYKGAKKAAKIAEKS